MVEAGALVALDLAGALVDVAERLNPGLKAVITFVTHFDTTPFDLTIILCTWPSTSLMSSLVSLLKLANDLNSPGANHMSRIRGDSFFKSHTLNPNQTSKDKAVPPIPLSSVSPLV